MVYYNPFDAQFLGYLVVDYTPEEYEAEVKRLEEYLLDGFDATTESAYYQKTTGK